MTRALLSLFARVLLAACVILAVIEGAGAHEMDPSTVKEIKGVGFLLKDTGETITYDRVQPSPDNSIWVSRWGGQSKCFFYPYGY